QLLQKGVDSHLIEEVDEAAVLQRKADFERVFVVGIPLKHAVEHQATAASTAEVPNRCLMAASRNGNQEIAG
ncbi:hypothetical protein V2A47_36485, partial [Pseudomonas aeruginosa]